MSVFLFLGSELLLPGSLPQDFSLPSMMQSMTNANLLNNQFGNSSLRNELSNVHFPEFLVIHKVCH